MAAKPQKRRGRPPGSKNKAAVVAGEVTAPKRRGRPPGKRTVPAAAVPAQVNGVAPFIAIGPGCWGIGESMADAVKAARAAMNGHTPSFIATLPLDPQHYDYVGVVDNMLVLYEGRG